MCAVQAIVDSAINLIMIILLPVLQYFQQSVPEGREGEGAVEYIHHTGHVGVTKRCQKFPW